MNALFDSRVGKLFVIAYALFTISMYVISFLCISGACVQYIIWPIYPWAVILLRDFGVSFPWMVYPVFVLLNASAAFIIGAFLEWLYESLRDWRHRRTENLQA